MRRLATIRETVTLGYRFHDWYSVANHEIREVCRRENWNPDTFAAVLALTSPRTPVRKNVQTTIRFFGQGGLHNQSLLPAIVKPLARYLQGEEVNGPKTGPFYLNLTGLNPYAITIDVWVARGLGIKESVPRKDREKGERIIRRIAAEYGILPCEAQAALWSGTILQSGGNPIYFPVMQEYLNWIIGGRNWNANGAIPRYVFSHGTQSRLALGE